jgi:hypothetical protein
MFSSGIANKKEVHENYVSIYTCPQTSVMGKTTLQINIL